MHILNMLTVINNQKHILGRQKCTILVLCVKACPQIPGTKMMFVSLSLMICFLLPWLMQHAYIPVLLASFF